MNHPADGPHPALIALLIGTIILSFLIGAGLSQMQQNDHWEREAVRRGVAQYNQQTGVWEWKTPPCLPVKEKP